jgi:hypothetical protein
MESRSNLITSLERVSMGRTVVRKDIELTIAASMKA